MWGSTAESTELQQSILHYVMVHFSAVNLSVVQCISVNHFTSAHNWVMLSIILGESHLLLIGQTATLNIVNSQVKCARQYSSIH